MISRCEAAKEEIPRYDDCKIEAKNVRAQDVPGDEMPHVRQCWQKNSSENVVGFVYSHPRHPVEPHSGDDDVCMTHNDLSESLQLSTGPEYSPAGGDVDV